MTKQNKNKQIKRILRVFYDNKEKKYYILLNGEKIKLPFNDVKKIKKFIKRKIFKKKIKR